VSEAELRVKRARGRGGVGEGAGDVLSWRFVGVKLGWGVWGRSRLFAPSPPPSFLSSRAGTTSNENFPFSHSHNRYVS
jgi:hypothetical protein